MRIFHQVEPKLRNVWPDVIDNQEEALGTGFVHWGERKAKVLREPDHTKEIALEVGFLASLFISPFVRGAKVSRHNSREAIGQKVLEHR
jgi:hypothetical protein